MRLGPGGLSTRSRRRHLQRPVQLRSAHGVIPNGLIQGTDGNFYVTTSQGGANGAGTVFKMTPGGSATVLYNFCSQSACSMVLCPAHLRCSKARTEISTAQPSKAVPAVLGTVFKMTPSGTLTTLHSFDLMKAGFPNAPLIQGADGNFYGTAYNRRGEQSGSIFGMTPAGSSYLAAQLHRK